MKILISVFDDIFEANGTTARVRRVLEVLLYKHEIAVATCCDKENQTRLTGLEKVYIAKIRGVRAALMRSKLFPVKIFPIVVWNLKLFSFLLKNNFDLVYCANDWFGFLSIYLAAKICKYRVIFEAHCIYSEESKEMGNAGILLKLQQTWERFVIKYSDHVIALALNILKFYQPYNNRVSLIPVFIEDTLFTRASKPSKKGVELRLVGLIGPFHTVFKKSHLDFLYTNLDRFDKRIKFVVIGDCRNRIENKRVEYTGYLESIQDYIKWLCCLDAVLIPEKVASMGPLNKIIEPMACEVPVFTTPKGMVGLYWVEPGKDVLVFEEDRLIDKVNELIFDDELMRIVGENARKVIEQYYSKRANEEKLLRILETVGGG